MSPKNYKPLPNAPQSAAKSREEIGQWIRFRLGFAYVCVVLFFCLIFFRLIQLQVIENPEVAQLAQKQFQRVGKIAPPRLSIYDRNREELAVSIQASSVFARPRLIPAKKRTARALARVLGGSYEQWYEKIRTQKPFVWLHRQISEDTAKELVKLHLSGIFIEPENKRIYPNSFLASHVLGFTDIDGNGISGVELALNDELLQKATKFGLVKDGKGTPSYIDKKYVLDDDGKTGVYLTIDRRLQYVLEEELDKAIEDTGAKAAMAIVMDPFTGEIYAMGQRPTFDPNSLQSANPNAITNRLISHLYEPGSTMKVLFAAEAIQHGLLSPDSLIDCEKGTTKIGKTTIHEAEPHEQFGRISLEKVMRFSSNVGAVKIAQLLGKEKAKTVLDRFGLTAKSGIRLPGEASSSAKPDEAWTPLQLATTGFGQGISVSPLQMVSAFAPFANGGYLIRPRILMRESVSSERAEVKRILSPTTVKLMQRMLVSVTEEKDGTGGLARVNGIHVAGKTGTAQKYEAGEGYKGKKYFGSFIGYLPADRPELLVGVMIDEPKFPFYGGQTAAPVFSRIASRSLQILNRVPKSTVAQADVVREKDFSDPTPPPDLSQNAQGQWLMPDLSGLSLRDALRLLGKNVQSVKISGDGYLKSQSPAPGVTINQNSSVDLQFSPAG